MAAAVTMPSTMVRGRLARASSRVFFSSPPREFSNRESTGNIRLRMPRAVMPRKAAAEKSIQLIAPVAAAFHTRIMAFPNRKNSARKITVGRIPAFQFSRKTCQNRCQLCLSPRRKPRKAASYRAAQDVPMVTTGTQPSIQNRLRKIPSVSQVMVTIRPLSGFRRLRNMNIPPFLPL